MIHVNRLVFGLLIVFCVLLLVIGLTTIISLYPWSFVGLVTVVTSYFMGLELIK